MSFVELLILGLAAHRFWAIWLFAEIARPLREKLIQRGGYIAYLSNCQFCLSVWSGFLAWLLWSLGWAGEWTVIGFALGSVLQFVDKAYALLTTTQAVMTDAVRLGMIALNVHPAQQGQKDNGNA